MVVAIWYGATSVYAAHVQAPLPEGLLRTPTELVQCECTLLAHCTGRRRSGGGGPGEGGGGSGNSGGGTVGNLISSSSPTKR